MSRLIGSATAISPASAPFDRDVHRRLPLARERSARVAQRRDVDASRVMSAALPTASATPLDHARHSAPRRRTRTTRRVPARGRVRARTARSRRPADARSCASSDAASAQQLVARRMARGAPARRRSPPGAPFGDRARLVEHHRRHVAGALQRLATLDQDAELGAPPVATITAVGTASPIAHGQAMISTATAAANARTTPVRWRRRCRPQRTRRRTSRCASEHHDGHEHRR